MFYPLHKKGGSFYEDPIIHKSGLERCMLFTSITRMYKLYLFPIKISGAITDFSVYVYHLLNRENGMVRYRLQMGCDCTAVVSFFFFLFFFYECLSPLGPHLTFHAHLQFWTVETSSFVLSTLFFSICECQASHAVSVCFTQCRATGVFRRAFLACGAAQT